MIAKVVDMKQRNWCDVIPGVMAAYRATQHDATGYSPNKLMFGRENRMPVDVMFGRPPQDPSGLTTHEFVASLQDDLNTAYDTVRKNLGAAAQYRKDRYDVGVKRSDITDGGWVWYFYPRRRTGLSPKWQSWYTGPYRVMKLIDSHCVRIQKTRKSQPITVHRDKLKPYYGDPPVDWLAPESARPTKADRRTDSNELADHGDEDSGSQPMSQAPVRLNRRQIVRPKRFEGYV